jgi:hypothetical protein
MVVLRLVLAAHLAVLAVYTAVVIANHGWNLFPVFFGDMAAMGWAGQFNLDFMGFLSDRQAVRTTTAWTVDQGREMGRPSRLNVRAILQNGTLAQVEVGGSAVLISDGVMQVE